MPDQNQKKETNWLFTDGANNFKEFAAKFLEYVRNVFITGILVKALLVSFPSGTTILFLFLASLIIIVNIVKFTIEVADLTKNDPEHSLLIWGVFVILVLSVTGTPILAMWS